MNGKTANCGTAWMSKIPQNKESGGLICQVTRALARFLGYNQPTQTEPESDEDEQPLFT
jgi:hypothetical protein